MHSEKISLGKVRKSRRKHRNIWMVCPQLRTVLPAEGIESGDWYLRYADH